MYRNSFMERNDEQRSLYEISCYLVGGQSTYQPMMLCMGSLQRGGVEVVCWGSRSWWREEEVPRKWPDPTTLQLVLSLQQCHNDADGGLCEIASMSPRLSHGEGHRGAWCFTLTTEVSIQGLLEEAVVKHLLSLVKLERVAVGKVGGGTPMIARQRSEVSDIDVFVGHLDEQAAGQTVQYLLDVRGHRSWHLEGEGSSQLVVNLFLSRVPKVYRRERKSELVNVHRDLFCAVDI